MLIKPDLTYVWPRTSDNRDHSLSILSRDYLDAPCDIVRNGGNGSVEVKKKLGRTDLKEEGEGRLRKDSTTEEYGWKQF